MTGLAFFCSDKIVNFVGAQTDNHRSVWFIFGSESSSPCRLLGITHSFQVTRKRPKCLESAFPAMKFSKFSGEGLRPIGFVPSVPAGDRLGLQPSLVGKACPCPSKNRFHPVCLCDKSMNNSLRVYATIILLLDYIGVDFVAQR